MYTTDYFIKKFEAIPEWLWYQGDYFNPDNKIQMCALGHCGERGRPDELVEEGRALDLLFTSSGINVANVNDGNDCKFQQPTPKQRILAALYSITPAIQPIFHADQITECQLN